MNKILILSHDDEYIKKIDRKAPKGRFEFFQCTHVEKAYDIIDEVNIDIVIVDDDNQGEILKKIKEKNRQIIRISVSELTASIEHYMPKDAQQAQLQCNKNCTPEELFILIEKVLEIEAKVKNKDLINLMSNLKHLPTVPKIYHQMTEMIQNNASVEEIANKLEEDPSITSNILKLANTAFYNAKTASIRQAIMYIGLINVKNIILSNAVFGDDGLDPKTRELHWEHVRLTNRILGAIYQDILRKKLNNNISSVGLLHDIGSVVLMSNFPKEFGEIAKRVNEDPKLMFHDLESELLGFNHEELGGYLLDLWGLPYPVIEAALCHHEPMDAGIINQELVKAVHLANHYAWQAMDHIKHDTHLNTDVFKSMGITQEAFETYFETLRKKL